MGLTSSAGAFGVLAGSTVVLLGLALAVRGLRGGAGGGGLLRGQAGALARVESWRSTVLGLAAAGLGASLVWELRWLLVLSLGIGFVEVLEASIVIAAWRAGDRRR